MEEIKDCDDQIEDAMKRENNQNWNSNKRDPRLGVKLVSI